MGELRTHHVGITVHDLDRAVAFYRDVLGLELLDEFTLSGESFATGVGVAGATGSFAHLGGDGARIELIEYEPEDEPQPTASINQPGAMHPGLSVGDVDGFYEGLPEAVETLSPPQTTPSGARILFVRDPEQNLIEVLEP